MSNAENLAALRREMQHAGVEAYLVPRADEHLGEYVPPSGERLAWLTGFTGSAGVALVLADRAAVFTDGRYVLQIQHQADPALWERLHVLETPPQRWLSGQRDGRRLGYDPRVVTLETIRTYAGAGIEMVLIEPNLVDRVWADRPPLPAAPLVIHPLAFAGESSASKRTRLAAVLQAEGQDAAVISDPASLCWLFNVRGNDLGYTPSALGFVLLYADGHADLFIDESKVTHEARSWLGNAVAVRPRAEMASALAGLAGGTVRCDEASQPAWFVQNLQANGVRISSLPDICAVAKAVKNSTEQSGMREAHIRDGVAVTRFLAYMNEAGPSGTETEISAAEKLQALRAEAPKFRGLSFPTISGAGEHGAIIHYGVTPDTDRAIRPDELYLVDSGAQYVDGTTDITRTIWTGAGEPQAEYRDRYTRVLKGHIAIDTAVFPHGTAGVHIDALARLPLWQVGLDFDHGTGHGIGSYLSVHEGPASISRPLNPALLEAGMIMSNEPGYYLPGAYGIRLENLLLVTPAADLRNAGKPFLRFEVLTFVPFDRRLIEPNLLTQTEIDWVDRYHARVAAMLSSRLDPNTQSWLQAACKPLGQETAKD